MNVFFIKFFAIIFMLIDHVGILFFPQYIVFPLLGRLSFPLFAWLIANGMNHTKNKQKYFLRLFFVALLSQVPYLLAFQRVDPHFYDLNVFFTLLGGFLLISLYQKAQAIKLWYGGCIFLLFSSLILPLSYGTAGILSIFFFYLFFTNKKMMFLSQLLVVILFFIIPTLFSLFTTSQTVINIGGLLQPFSLFALLFIWLYDGTQGPRLTYMFYLVYPVHLLLLYAISRI